MFIYEGSWTWRLHRFGGMSDLGGLFMRVLDLELGCESCDGTDVRKELYRCTCGPRYLYHITVTCSVDSLVFRSSRLQRVDWTQCLI